LNKAPKLRFVGSATSGADHFRVSAQEAWQRGVYLYYAAGCNSRSVVEYVVTVLLRWRALALLPARARIAVVGAGHIGGRLLQLLPLMGFEVDFFDPHISRGDLFRRWAALSDRVAQLASPDELAQADAVTFHVPWVAENQAWSTVSYVPRFWQPSRGQLLINSSRGEVLDLDWLAHNPVRAVALDVFPHEPDIHGRFWGVQGREDTLFTPHIAGYSWEGRRNGSAMVAQEYARFVGAPVAENARDGHLAEGVRWLNLEESLGFLSSLSEPEVLYRIALLSMPLERDSDSFWANPESFAQLRKNYPVRREFRYYGITLGPKQREQWPGLAQSLSNLGFAVSFVG
jgi:erythronate-4-phosphate dehydrogenase